MSNVLKNQPEPVTTSIEERHFPSLYQSADQASLSAQRHYFRLQTGHVACLILGSAGAVLATILPVASVTWAYIVLAIVLAISIVFAWVSRERQYDRVWFDCRAIAESTKTATWRFMMKAAPFKDDSTARQSFIDQLRRIRKARPSSPKDLAQSLDENARLISCSMDSVRQKPLNERQKIYLKSRLLDQKIWYLNKAKFNSRKESFLFGAVLTLQILAVFFCNYSGCFKWLSRKRGPNSDDLRCFRCRLESDEALWRIGSDLFPCRPGTRGAGSDCLGFNGRRQLPRTCGAGRGDHFS